LEDYELQQVGATGHHGRHGLVSAGHSLGALAGVRVLQEGGNAIDAALAAAFVMAVVKPESCGPGGDLFALVYVKKNGKVEAINSSGPAPGKANIDYFREQGTESVPTSGPLSVARCRA
jgi:gamma-glutamyltranspeptidase/glutathione hydrolase